MNAIIKAYTLSECMEAMSEQVEKYEKAGGVNLVFCEDRLTLIAERAIVKRLGGTFSTSVSTFTRFLKADARTVTKQGSVMMVGEVMTALQRQEKLQCFKTLAGVGNNARCIYETLAQFSASAITPSMLKKVSEELPEDTLKRKVCDLALIYEGYKSALKEKSYLDESEYLSLLPGRKDCLKASTCFSFAIPPLPSRRRSLSARFWKRRTTSSAFFAQAKKICIRTARWIRLRAFATNTKRREF